MPFDGFPSQSGEFDSRCPLHYFSGVFGQFRPNLSTNHSKSYRAESRTNPHDHAQCPPIWLAHRLAPCWSRLAPVRPSLTSCSVSPVGLLECRQEHAPVPVNPSFISEAHMPFVAMRARADGPTNR
jgi:hypothetical protein